MAYKHSPYAMKKLTFMMLLAAFFTLCVTSCSKDDDDSFAYPMEQGKPLRLRLMVNGMMLPNTLIHVSEWTSPSMRMANSMALATWETAVALTLLAAKPLQRMLVEKSTLSIQSTH